MQSSNPNKFIFRALLSLNCVLVIAFLGFGIRAFATEDATELILSAAFVMSLTFLALYFTFRHAREPTSQSPLRAIPLAKPHRRASHL
jgi:hypothetical protein